ncbi:galactose mutarotase [Flammeovirgaceae bacterium KN852]|uniref:Aldose 1-epimerase n=1 Tax=Marinigracilibium pacificum TaxID=2729599 RepID=A0A848J524_9BACT|nr:galactose mutarotase [Marinigracilibium pacificum]
MQVDKWGNIEDYEIFKFTLENRNGTQAEFSNYGAHWLSLRHLNMASQFTDLLLGYETLEELIYDKFFFGSTIGRFANRIAKGKFRVEDQEYTLSVNNGPNHLHGGSGFNTKVWDYKIVEDKIQFTYLSKDSEDGYPGNLKVHVTYSLSDDDELIIDYFASTDAPTIVSLTNHAYFNLNGSGSILDHKLQINSEKFTPIDSTSIPLGYLKSVSKTPFDFRTPKLIRNQITMEDEQLVMGSGFDHNYVLQYDSLLYNAATLISESSGRGMDVFTTMPGIQFYSGNFLDGVKGKGGANYKKNNGVCLETQFFPDSPNHMSFPSAILNPMELYRHQSVYKFYNL